MAEQSYARRWLERSFHRGIGMGDAIGGMAGNLVTFVAHSTPWWRSEMTDLAWQIPVFALAGAMLWRLCSTPFELWREQKERADKAEALIHALSIQPALQFTQAIFRWDPREGDENGPALATVELHHQNLGQHILQYTLENVWIEIANKRLEIDIEKRGINVPPLHPGRYLIPIPPVSVKEFPVLIRVNFDYIYDTRPPVGRRKLGLTGRYILGGWKQGDPVEGMFFDEQRDEP